MCHPSGDVPNVVGLVYIAAFAPDAGESPDGISQAAPPVAIAEVSALIDEAATDSTK